nr:uncharacterized protein LOC107279647 [Oryza sativa Japonica Group]
MLDGVTAYESIPVQDVHQDIPSFDYIEFDSRIFEPALNNLDDESNVKLTQTCDVVDSDDEEFQNKDNGYESYRVDIKGVNSVDVEDPYDYVYHNLPEKHHVLKKRLIASTVGRLGFSTSPLDSAAGKGR